MAALALAERDQQGQAARLAQLQRDAALADKRVIEAQSALDQLRAAARARGNASAPAAAPARDPLDDGKKFLATVGPARAMMIDAFKGVVRVYKPYFYRFASLTPAQTEAFENLEAVFR